MLRLSDQADSCQCAQLHKPGGHISILEKRERNDTSKAVEIKCTDHPVPIAQVICAFTLHLKNLVFSKIATKLRCTVLFHPENNCIRIYIQCELLSLMNPAVYLLNNYFVIVVSAPEFCQKLLFLLQKRMKGIFAYVLERMLTLDKTQNTSSLMCKKFEI